MMNDWKSTLSNLVQGVGNFAKSNKPVAEAFQKLDAATGENGVLDAKTRELISLAVAVTTRCDGCISAHAMAAQKAGASKAEVAAALGTAIALNAGAAMVYSARAMDAFDQLSA